MRSLLSVLLTFCASTLLSAENFTSSNRVVEIIWDVETNKWPAVLWTYKVTPQEFSPSVISNLLAVAHFTEKDKTNSPDTFSEKDGNSLFWRDLKGGSRHLVVCPTIGYIEYRNENAEASSQFHKVEGVPNQQDATLLSANRQQHSRPASRLRSLLALLSSRQ